MYHRMQYLKIKDECPRIQDLVNTLRTQYRTESVIADLSKTREFNTFSQESRRTIKKWERSYSLNWEKFLRKYSARPAPCTGQRDLYCTCGICSRPSKEQKHKTKENIEVLSIRYHNVKKNYSRGAKHDANESTRHAKNTNFLSITDRRPKDELYRNSQIAIGWTEERCQYLDSLVAIDISYTAACKERER